MDVCYLNPTSLGMKMWHTVTIKPGEEENHNVEYLELTGMVCTYSIV